MQCCRSKPTSPVKYRCWYVGVPQFPTLGCRCRCPKLKPMLVVPKLNRPLYLPARIESPAVCRRPIPMLLLPVLANPMLGGVSWGAPALPDQCPDLPRRSSTGRVVRPWFPPRRWLPLPRLALRVSTLKPKLWVESTSRSPGHWKNTSCCRRTCPRHGRCLRAEYARDGI